jgi:hypothetical protein
MLVPVIADVELNWPARSVPVQNVIHAARNVHNQRHGHHHQVQFLAEVIFNEARFTAKIPFCVLRLVGALL